MTSSWPSWSLFGELTLTFWFQRIDVPNELTFFTEILNVLTVQNELRWELENRIRNYLKSEKIHSIRIAKYKPSVKVMAILNTVIDQMVSLYYYKYIGGCIISIMQPFKLMLAGWRWKPISIRLYNTKFSDWWREWRSRTFKSPKATQSNDRRLWHAKYIPFLMPAL